MGKILEIIIRDGQVSNLVFYAQSTIKEMGKILEIITTK